MSTTSKPSSVFSLLLLVYIGAAFTFIIAAEQTGKDSEPDHAGDNEKNRADRQGRFPMTEDPMAQALEPHRAPPWIFRAGPFPPGQG